MDIREFIFRHMHGTETGRATSDKPNAVELDRELRKCEIKNDPECRDMCGRFLWSEIYHGGLTEVGEVIYKYDPDYWEPIAEYFINNIVPSNDFMHDCITFFADIREGKGENYDS